MERNASGGGGELFCAATVCSRPLVVFLHDDPLGFGVIGGEERHWQGVADGEGGRRTVGGHANSDL